MILQSCLAGLLVAALAPASIERSGAGGTEKVLSLRPYVSRAALPAGEGLEFALVVELHGSWHINSATPKDPLLIPTRLTLELPPGVSSAEPVWPAPKNRKFEFADDPLLVYEGKFQVRVGLKAAADAAAGETTLRGKLRYQACDDERCLAPREEAFALPLRLAAAGAEAGPVNPEVFGGPAAPPRKSGATTAPGGAAGGGTKPGWLSAESFGGLFERGNYLAAFATIFLIGLALNLTPCVYPVIPITLGYFANQSERRGGKTFALALVYVLGMALMYSVLGAFAALSGKAFGTALANPWVLLFVAAAMVALATSMFGLWDISVPGWLSRRISESPSGYAGALFMGLTVGIVAAPCLAPAVLGLFLFVAQLQSVPLGFAIFFVLALGLGFPFLLLGTASGAIARLPRSGEWMVWIKQVFGFLLLGMALYFLRPLAGTPVFLWGLALLGVIGSFWLGWIAKVNSASSGFRAARVAVSVVFLIGSGAALALALRPAEEAKGIRWTAYADGRLSSALEGKRPVLIDFTAEWCLPCKELEHTTFAHESVRTAAERFVALRADGTVNDDPAIARLMEQWSVKGFPTVLFIDSQGKERQDLRVVGFVDPADFRSRLEQVN